MCGFGGIVHWNRQEVDPEELGRMVTLLRYRGPDQLCAVLPDPWVGLAHARLKVIDLSDGARQPMSSEDKKVWLLYNGEIYNFRELRQELKFLGASFHSQSDTEVVLRAYEAWGVQAISRLDGMFALAIWDRHSQTLLLARDRTGKKPLFYWTDGECVTFGSEIKALHSHSHVPVSVNERVLPFLLAFGYPPTGETCYQEIAQVPPATYLILRQGERHPRPVSYWEIPLEKSRGQATQSRKMAKEELRQRLTEAVRRRLVADVPLGAFLSGGIDSTIVVGLMSKLTSRHPVKTFSIGFTGDERFNETPFAQEAASAFQTDHTVFNVTPQSFDLLEKLVWHHDQPFGDSSAIPMFLISRLAKEHVTVALTGDGGDEAFAGYTRFLAALWSERLPRFALEASCRLLRRIPQETERSLFAQASRFTSVARFPLPERYWRWIAYFREPSSLLAGGASHVNGMEGLHASLGTWWKLSEGSPLLSRLLYLNFKEYLPNDLLVKADRCSMAHGLEIRSPFLDTALLEYAATLPNPWKATPWATKILLKEAFQDLLPPVIQNRKKMGFGVPLGTWFRKQWRQGLQDLLTPATACVYRYLNRPTVQDLMARHFKGVEDAGHRLWLLLTLEVWLRRLTTQQTSQTTAEVVWLERSGS